MYTLPVDEKASRLSGNPKKKAFILNRRGSGLMGSYMLVGD